MPAFPAVLAAISGVVVARAQLLTWLAQIADGRAAPAGSSVAVTGARVHVRRAGTGLPVLFVHGFAGDGRTFDRVVPLAAPRFDCVVVDRPGHGRSTRGRGVRTGSPMTQAAQLDEVMAMLGCDRYLVVCHSWGCYVGLALALLRPGAVAGVVLAGCVAVGDGPSRTGWQPRSLARLPVLGPMLWRSMAVSCRGSFEAALAVLFAPEPVEPGFVAASVPSVFLHAGHVRAATEDFLAAAAQVPRHVDAYRGIASPMRILVGADDGAAPSSIHARPLHGALQRSWLEVVDGAGHMLPVTRPEVVVAALEALADDVEEEARHG